MPRKEASNFEIHIIRFYLRQNDKHNVIKYLLFEMPRKEASFLLEINRDSSFVRMPN
jgi:hypothetical protein